MLLDHPPHTRCTYSQTVGRLLQCHNSILAEAWIVRRKFVVMPHAVNALLAPSITRAGSQTQAIQRGRYLFVDELITPSRKPGDSAAT